MVMCGLVAMTVLLSACAPRIDTRGNSIHPNDLKAIKVGSFTRNNVLVSLGSPSSKSDFGGETWYYISETTETNAFLEPKLTSRQVVRIRFDKNGLVKSVKSIDPQQAQKVELAPGATPTAGTSLSFFEQIISNLGRFNKK